MIRMTKLSDYGLVLLTHFARHEDDLHSAVELAQAANLPLPTVGKILKILAKEGILGSNRGAKGGYKLARRPSAISVISPTPSSPTSRRRSRSRSLRQRSPWSVTATVPSASMAPRSTAWRRSLRWSSVAPITARSCAMQQRLSRSPAKATRRRRR